MPAEQLLEIRTYHVLRAVETDGRTELLKVLDQDTPPRVIRCGTSGCS